MGMRRLIPFILTFCILLCLAGTAFADVIYSPQDEFLSSHPCDYEGRTYVVNAPSGYTGIYPDPDHRDPVAFTENDLHYYVYYIYTDGNASWGLVDWMHGPDGNAQPGVEENGWILLADCYRRYDSEAFLEEYGNQMKTDSEAVKTFRDSLSEGQELQFYAFPGSDRITSTLPVDENSLDEIRNNLTINRVFIDENGLVWCHVGYFWGRRDWLCLSDPTSTELPVISRGSIPDRFPPVEPEAQPASPSTGANIRTMTLTGILVVLLAVGSGLLIHFLGRKKRA